MSAPNDPRALDGQADLEALIPLYVGGDLEPEQMDLVAERLAADPELAGRAQEALVARSVYIDHASSGGAQGGELVDVWPGLREDLRAEGLIACADGRSVASGGALLGGPWAGWLGSLVGVAALLALYPFLRPEEPGPRALPARAAEVLVDAEAAPLDGVDLEGQLRPALLSDERIAEEVWRRQALERMLGHDPSRSMTQPASLR